MSVHRKTEQPTFRSSQFRSGPNVLFASLHSVTMAWVCTISVGKNLVQATCVAELISPVRDKAPRSISYAVFFCMSLADDNHVTAKEVLFRPSKAEN